jgi:hypothetical protein
MRHILLSEDMRNKLTDDIRDGVSQLQNQVFPQSMREQRIGEILAQACTGAKREETQSVPGQQYFRWVAALEYLASWSV